jgi:hypothetical protein
LPALRSLGEGGQISSFAKATEDRADCGLATDKQSCGQGRLAEASTGRTARQAAPACECNLSESRIPARILGSMDTLLLNAKAQRPKGAESSFLLCVFATWRLCVEKSFLSVKSVKSVVPFLWLRPAALCFLRLFAEKQRKCLSMNNLQLKSCVSN